MHAYVPPLQEKTETAPSTSGQRESNPFAALTRSLSSLRQERPQFQDTLLFDLHCLLIILLNVTLH